MSVKNVPEMKNPKQTAEELLAFAVQVNALPAAPCKLHTVLWLMTTALSVYRPIYTEESFCAIAREHFDSLHDWEGTNPNAPVFDAIRVAAKVVACSMKGE